MTADCIFCAIVTGTAPSRTIAEDERTLAFLDIFPLTPGHALVVPKAHCTSILDAPADDLAAVALMAQRVARVAAAPPPDGLGAEGVNLLQATGAVAFQTVFHLHVHVLPRNPGDGFRFEVQRRAGDDAALTDQAARYRQALGAV